MATQSKRPTHLQDSINVYTRQLQWLLFLFFRIFFIHYWLHLTQISPLLNTLPGSPRAHRPPSPLGKSVAIDRSWVLTLAHTWLRTSSQYPQYAQVLLFNNLWQYSQSEKTMDSLQLPPGLPSSADGALTGSVLCLIILLSTLLDNIFILILCYEISKTISWSWFHQIFKVIFQAQCSA